MLTDVYSDVTGSRARLFQ